MSELVNVQTKKAEKLPDNQIAQSILDGTHQYQAGTMVEMRDEENNPVSIPAENVQKALSMGFRPYGFTERALDEYSKDNEGIKGSLKVGLGQFADETLMGVPELILDHTQDPFERAKRERLKKDHAFANTLGGIGGAGASLLIGGPLFKAGAKAGEVAARGAEALAANIAAKAGADLGKNAATRAAKAIVGKMAGGAVEGAVISSPHALTEAALGDPELAAESMLWGGGIGAVLGGGGAAAKELMGLTGRAAKKGYEWLGGKPLTAENVKLKLAEYGLGVPAEDIAAYMKNRDRLIANESRTGLDIKDGLDEAAGARFTAQAEAETAWKAAKAEADTHYKTKLDQFRTEKPDMDIAQAITSDLNAAKATIGDMSAEAEDILAASGEVFSRAVVKRRFTNAMKKYIGKEVGETAKAAGTKMRSLMEDIQTNYGADISANEMRDIVRKLRGENDSLFNKKAAGEFNDYLENALGAVHEGMQNEAKRKIPDYAAKMAELAPLVKGQKRMQKKFGNVEMAMSSINQLAGGQRSAVIDRLLGDWSRLRGTDFLSTVKGFTENKALLAKSRLEDLRPSLIPNLHAAERGAYERWQELARQNEPIRRLTPQGTAAAIQNQSGMRSDVAKSETRKALDALSQLEGKTMGVDDYWTQIDDRRVLDSFDKTRINGSRRVNLFGAMASGTLGGLIGGPLGAGLGAAAGAVIDIDGGKILRRMLDGETILGPLFLEKSIGGNATKIDRIPEILGNMKKRATEGTRLTPSPVEGGRLLAIKAMAEHMVGDEHKDDRQELTSALNNRLSSYAANPGLMADDVGMIAGQLEKTGAPITAGIGAQKLSTALTYLNANIPKPPRMNTPFSMPVKWKPSSFQMKGFEEKLEVVVDPFSALSHLENGSLTRNHMEAMKAVYPALHGIIQKRVFSAVAEGEIPLGYTDRLKLSLVMDMPLDQSMQNISRHQQTFAKDPNGTQSADTAGASYSVRPKDMNQSERYAQEKY